MLRNRPLIATLSLTLLAAVTGCSPAIPPQATSSDSDASRSQVNSANASTNKQAISAMNVTPPEQPLTVSVDNLNPAEQSKIEKYVNGLATKGFPRKSQGVWIQTGDKLLANHQGTVPLPAASITKVATSLAALSTFGPDHKFITVIAATGPIQNGILKGDLVIQGNQDPFFVWEEAIALGNLLNQIGIKRVTGNLVITGKFYMNYEYDPLKSGNLLKTGINYSIWPVVAQAQYQTLPPGTPRPQVVIDGAVQVKPSTPSNAKTLVRHYSPPLSDLVKKMNRYSNNKMAEMIADSVGGAKEVAKKASVAAGVPQQEIKLVNGSGLSIDNKISPRAAVALFLAIERYLKPLNMTVGDVFTVVGQDKSILDERQIPQLSVVKSGSLDDVSALAGALPTKERGIVWFAIMNGGKNLEGFRTQQEALLKGFVNQWGNVDSLPSELNPTVNSQEQTSRNEVVN